MSSVDTRSLARWRRNPVSWIETHLVDPETGKPFKLLEAEKQFIRLALAVGPDEIAVGSSLYGKRLTRDLLPGFVTFLDRSYRRIARLHLPAAPTQIRRLDGLDLSLSQPRQWRQTSQYVGDENTPFPTADFMSPKSATLT